MNLNILKEIWDRIIENCFIPIYTPVANYIDGLSLLQESAVVHLCIYFLILITLFNIIFKKIRRYFLFNI